MKRAIVAAAVAGCVALPSAVQAQTVTVVNEAHINHRALVRVERALRIQVNRQLHAYWHTPRIRFGRHGWPVVLKPQRKVNAEYGAPAGGFHSIGRGDRPYAVVAVNRSLFFGAARYGPYSPRPMSWPTFPSWQMDMSHELVEMLVDSLPGQTPEVCDASDGKGYVIDRVSVAVFDKPHGGRVLTWYHRHAS